MLGEIGPYPVQPPLFLTRLRIWLVCGIPVCIATQFFTVCLLVNVCVFWILQVRDGGGGGHRQDPVRGPHGAPRVAGGGAVQQAPPRAGEDRLMKEVLIFFLFPRALG